MSSGRLGQDPVEQATGQQAAQYSEQPGREGDRVAVFGVRAAECVQQRCDAGFAWQGKTAGTPFALQPAQGLLVGGLMAAGCGIYVAQEGGAGIGPKAGVDGTGLDQADLHAAACQLQAQGIGIPFQRELAGVVGAAILHGHQPQHRAVLHDAPLAGRQHGRQQLANEVVPAEQVGVELLAQRLGGQILQRAGLAVGAVVEQAIQAATGQCLRLGRAPLYAGLVGQVQLDGQQTQLAQLRHVLGLAGGGDDGVTVLAERLGGGQADAAGAAGDQNEAGHGRILVVAGQAEAPAVLHVNPLIRKKKTGPIGPVC